MNRRGLTWASSLSQGWQSALESLAAHKLRSILTLLGIVVGVAAVLAVNALGQLTQQTVAHQFGPLGATLINVGPQPPPPPTAAVPGGGPVTFTAGAGTPRPILPPDLDEKDLQAIQTLPHVTAAALHRFIPPVQAIANGQNGQARLIGATPSIQGVMGYSLAAGTFFTDQDETARVNVVVIGASVERALFPNQDPVGQQLQLNNVPFTVKGVLTSQGSNGELDLDQLGLVPYSVVDRLRGTGGTFIVFSNGSPIANNGVSIQADAVENVPRVETSVIQLIQQLHPPKPGEQPYVASDFAEAVQAASQSTAQVRLALGGVATVALLLGAFGVFSMLTVSVTERTREIGLRMAVGARTRDVLTQFLLEAALLGLIGGVLGAVLGSILVVLAPSAIRAFGGQSAQPSMPAVLGVVLGACVLGIVFGVVPARRAANLDPAAALRRV
jgi:putative ABC transport system permease protein